MKGYPKREWQKTRDRNEALDCRVYARAATIALGLDRWSDNKWEMLINQQNGKSVKPKEESQRSRIVRSWWM